MSVSNSAVRKWATGTGVKQVKNKSSDANPMIVKARLCLPRNLHARLDEHSADAVCLYNYVLEKGLVT